MLDRLYYAVENLRLLVRKTSEVSVWRASSRQIIFGLAMYRRRRR